MENKIWSFFRPKKVNNDLKSSEFANKKKTFQEKSPPSPSCQTLFSEVPMLIFCQLCCTMSEKLCKKTSKRMFQLCQRHRSVRQVQIIPFLTFLQMYIVSSHFMFAKVFSSDCLKSLTLVLTTVLFKSKFLKFQRLEVYRSLEDL